jgi:hypothetical protein
MFWGTKMKDSSAVLEVRCVLPFRRPRDKATLGRVWTRSSSVTGTNAHVPYSPELDTALLAAWRMCVSCVTRHSKIDCVEFP